MGELSRTGAEKTTLGDRHLNYNIFLDPKAYFPPTFGIFFCNSQSQLTTSRHKIDVLGVSNPKCFRSNQSWGIYVEDAASCK